VGMPWENNLRSWVQISQHPSYFSSFFFNFQGWLLVLIVGMAAQMYKYTHLAAAYHRVIKTWQIEYQISSSGSRVRCENSPAQYLFMLSQNANH
jgi:hypothetical protein